jgi:tRNA pseudouridine55 synthase
VDKPAGPTSHDVVDAVRRALGVRRVGHTGTLDPFATGVLPVCVGKATRLARFLAEGDKEYDAVVRLGYATSTDDATGEPLSEPSTPVLAGDAVERACAGLRGPIRQVPPAFSAKRVAGRRLYELAREGVRTEPAAVPVEVHALEVTRVEPGRLGLRVRCSPGTYVRALARDLGARLGCGGHLEALRRTASSGFGLADAVTAAELGPGLERRLRPLRGCLDRLPEVRVGAEGRAAIRHGRGLTAGLVTAGFPGPGAEARLRVVDEDGDLIALAVPRGFGPPVPGLPSEPTLHPDVVLVD